MDDICFMVRNLENILGNEPFANKTHRTLAWECIGQRQSIYKYDAGILKCKNAGCNEKYKSKIKAEHFLWTLG